MSKLWPARCSVISSSSSGHEVRPINDLFQPHYYIRPIVSQSSKSYSSDRSIIIDLFWVSNIFYPDMNQPFNTVHSVRNYLIN